MFAILFIHERGGVISITGDTILAATRKALERSVWLQRVCVASTIPFACKPSSDGFGWDSTPSLEVVEYLGEELMKLYQSEG